VKDARKGRKKDGIEGGESNVGRRNMAQREKEISRKEY
jgi:hypothetical protein